MTYRASRFLLITGFLFSSISTFSQEGIFRGLLDVGKAELKKQVKVQFPDFTYAVSMLTEAVNLNPNSAEAHYFLGYALDRQNAFDGSMMPFTKKELTLKASEHFEKTNALQQVYEGEVFVLDPYSKLTTVWGSLAMAYLNRNAVDSAKWAFREGKKRGGFIEPVLEYNRQMLNSCSTKAICITAGDNITIPMWYLQTIENLRTDVIVADAKLMGAPWYLKFLQRNHLEMALKDADIDSLRYLKWSTRDITLHHPSDRAQTFSWTLKPTYFGSYILANDRALLAVLQKNLFTRDIYFPVSTDTSFNLFLMSNMVDDGIVSLLRPKQKNSENPHRVGVDHYPSRPGKPLVISANLERYNLEKVDPRDIYKSRDAVWLLNGFRITFLRNIYALFSNNQLDEAMKLMQMMKEKFDPKKLPYNSASEQENVRKLEVMIQRSSN